MNPCVFSLRRIASLASVVVLSSLLGSAARAQLLTQTVVLHPGWNAVWLEVDPADRSPAQVFGGLPLESAWTWSERVTATDFIQNPATAGWNRNQWLAWFPTNSPHASLANLYSVLPARGYLVKLGGAAPVTWRVAGRVMPAPSSWSAGRYNLRGLPVDTDSPPTFREFFRHSPAHWDADVAMPLPIYRLGTNGVWSTVAAGDLVSRGEAYWIFAKSAADYPAPKSLHPSTGDGIYFSPLAFRASLTIANLATEPRTVTFKALTPAAADAIQVEHLFPSNPNEVHTPLNLHHETLRAGERRKITLYLDRIRMPGGIPAQLFTADDGHGTLQYLPVASDGGGLLGAANNEAYPLAGLWLGTATLQAVGEAHATNAAPPTPVQAPFNLRLLLFVDTNGAASLLREATLVTLPDTYTNVVSTNLSGAAITNTLVVSGPQVLLSNPSLTGQYQARYGTAAGVLTRRFTAAPFDNGSSPDGMAMTGTFITNGVLNGGLTLPYNHPTNPYYHRYHPDHDNLDAQYQAPWRKPTPSSARSPWTSPPAGTGFRTLQGQRTRWQLPGNGDRSSQAAAAHLGHIFAPAGFHGHRLESAPSLTPISLFP
ncbi:MAG: hypothetical protein KIT22_03310 [Verrucomicrobiae bacterium]|nr:hypothetical protein [Verrucomicrobiae bacterium]